MLNPFFLKLMTLPLQVGESSLDEQAELETYMVSKGRELLEEGRAEGRAQGLIEALVGLVRDGLLSVAEAAKRGKMTESEFKKLVAAKEV